MHLGYTLINLNNAVKAVEIGAGMAAAELTGEENADEIRVGNNGAPHFTSNHAGGILGGISTGQEVVVNVAIKPTSSIAQPRRSIDRHGNAAKKRQCAQRKNRRELAFFVAQKLV